MSRTLTLAVVVLAIAASVIAGALVYDQATEPKVVASPTLEKFAKAIDKTPKCADIWVVGKKLPAKYGGCMSSPETIEAAISMCEGVNVWQDEQHDRTYYTDPTRTIHGGGPINQADPEYDKVLADNC